VKSRLPWFPFGFHQSPSATIFSQIFLFLFFPRRFLKSLFLLNLVFSRELTLQLRSLGGENVPLVLWERSLCFLFFFFSNNGSQFVSLLMIIFFSSPDSGVPFPYWWVNSKGLLFPLFYGVADILLCPSDPHGSLPAV